VKLPPVLVKHPRLRRLLWAVVVTLVLFTVLGFLVAPPVARSFAESKLSALLHREVTIGQVRVNPYALSVTVRGFRIRDADKARDLLVFKELYANVEAASLFKGGVVVKQVRLVEPAIGLVRLTEDRYNFSDILDDFTKEPAKPKDPKAKPARFSVNNIEVIGGRVDFDDRLKATKHQVTGIDVGIPFVSNFPALVETFVQPSFAAVINGTPLALKGRTKPFADSLESSIDVNLAKVDVPYYLAYVPMKLRPKVRSGTLDTRLKVTFSQYRDRPPRVDIAGSVVLADVDVLDDVGAPLLAIPRLDVELASSDLLESKATVKRVLLQSPTVHVRRGKRGELQLASLFAPEPAPRSQPKGPAAAKPPAPASAPAAKEKPAPPWLIAAAEVTLAEGRIVFADTSNAKPFQTTLYPLTIDVKGFSTAPGHKATLALRTTTDAKETIAIDGSFGIDPVAFDGKVVAKGLPLPRYAPYYAAAILFDLLEGTLDAEVPLKVAAKGKDLAISATGLRADLRALRLRKRGEREDFLRVPTLGVRQTNLDLDKKELVLGDVASDGARVRVERRGKDQPWNLETLTPPAPPAAAAAPAAPAPAGPAPAGPATKPFTVLVQKLDFRAWAVRLEDRAQRTPALFNLDRLGLRVEGLGTERGRQGRVTLQTRLNQSGSLNVTGTVGITPLQADVKVQLKTVPIVALQPYFADQVALLVTNGHIGANGRVTLATLPKGMGITYKGEAGVGDVVAMDKSGVDELFRLGSVQVSGIDMRTEPFKLGIGEVALSDYVARLVVNPDKTINLAAISGGGPASQPAAGAKPGAAPAAAAAKPAPAAPAAAPASAPAGPAQPIRIGALVLARGTVSVTDRSIQPAFNIRLTDLGGRITGLGFEEADRADVKLDGKLGGGPIAITGKLNPLAKKIYVDLVLRLSDLDLSGMTPYSGKYVGYAIEKGQLSLDLAYQINARKLDSKNKVRIDQFTFGQSIKSKDATKLPVRLAVALLKDRKGVIQLDLPVNGSLDDPKFKVWGVVLMMLKNLLVKAATSPFTLIASLLGKGEEMQWLEFPAGRYQVTEAGRGKLDSLAKALYERPALRLEIEGHADPFADHEALKKRGVQRKVKAQRLKETVGGGAEASAVDAVVVPQQEYPRYLKKAFDAEKLKRSKGATGEITVGEMEQLLAATVVVTADDLRILARQRAQVTREYLLRGGKIAPERVFMVEPKSLKPEFKKNVKDSRVDFRLR
jgi:flagellar motor protein MotB